GLDRAVETPAAPDDRVGGPGPGIAELGRGLGRVVRGLIVGRDLAVRPDEGDDRELPGCGPVVVVVPDLAEDDLGGVLAHRDLRLTRREILARLFAARRRATSAGGTVPPYPGVPRAVSARSMLRWTGLGSSGSSTLTRLGRRPAGSR